MEDKDDLCQNKETAFQTNALISMGKRLLYFDIIKLFGIFCVVWAHVLQNLTVIPNYWLTDPLCKLIISFHMPLFMMTSGYFAYSSCFKPSPFNVAKRKFIQIIIPSVIWGLMVTGMAMLVHLDFSTEKFKFMAGNTLFSYWFLKSLFFCYVLMLIGVRLLRISRFYVAVYIILVASLSNYLDYSNSMSMMPYFLCGIILHHNKERISRMGKPLFMISLFAYLLVFSFWSLSEYNMYSHPYGFSELQPFIIRTIIGLSGGLCWILLIKHLVSSVKRPFWDKCAKIGQMTMGIYLIQLIFAESICKILSGHAYAAYSQSPPRFGFGMTSL